MLYRLTLLCLPIIVLGNAFAKDNSLHIQRVSLMDPTGFEKPMESASSLLPADWKTEGGIIWRIQGECSRGYMLQWQATSPDGAATITMYPNVGWRASSMQAPLPQDCMAGSFGSAEEFATAMIQGAENGRIVDVQRNPNVQQQLSIFNYEQPGDPYMKSWADAASITTEYTVNGTAFQSVVNLYTMHSYMKSGHTYGVGEPLEMAYGGAFATTEFAAPKSRFSEFMPIFLLFENNYQVNPEWQARINKANRKMAKDNLETARKIGEINASTSREISAMNMDSWRKRQASEDRLSRERTEMIFGQETYAADTPTGQIELPFGYERAFQLQDGSFVVTNDQFFEPSKDLGQPGKALNALP
ncbi:MAG: hypothetical protein KTR32_35715 [Granulosicoccus sp.]|nr:hypothetical protein [Granulosicoccus sp.]